MVATTKENVIMVTDYFDESRASSCSPSSVYLNFQFKLAALIIYD